MRQSPAILLTALVLAACFARRGTTTVSASVPPASPSVADATSDSATGARNCAPGHVCISGRTGPYTGNPLYVIDGVEYEFVVDSLGRRSPPPDLRPEDIESVEVMTSSQAVERFGPRARDGVIVIRTKRAAGTTPAP